MYRRGIFESMDRIISNQGRTGIRRPLISSRRRSRHRTLMATATKRGDALFANESRIDNKRMTSLAMKAWDECLDWKLYTDDETDA